MALILADTDVLIDYLTGRQPTASQVKKFIQAEMLQTSAVTCFELLSGARDDIHGVKTRDFVNDVSVLPLDRISAAHAAGIRQTLDDHGASIGMADSLIAGIALANDVPLLTRNRRHFEKVAGLKLVPIAADRK